MFGTARALIGEDRVQLVSGIDEIVRTAEEISAALETGLATLAVSRAELVAGVPLQRWLEDGIRRGGVDDRLAISNAIKAYEHAVMVFRRFIVSALIDGNHMRITEVARLLNTSRQNVSRLYHEVD
jgi:hypothetical protein